MVVRFDTEDRIIEDNLASGVFTFDIQYTYFHGLLFNNYN